MRTLNQSSKLAHVCYEIRGPVLEEAKRLEDEGHRILKLNIGNPAPFGFVDGVGIEDIYLGNGVSELIVMAMQGLLDDGDEVLIPAPDYPLWTAAASLAGGRPVHYLCDEAAG